MILPKHPDLMSDVELSDWVENIVKAKTPESIFLDYKEAVTTFSPSDKREIAKDISSFANELGGVVLYGVPEDRNDAAPLPVDFNFIGMNRITGLPQVIEDILVGALTPRLPELRVREIPLVSLSDEKVVYLVWHPESWEAPHMIHAYQQHKYYRRGNYRAVPMHEHEVERLYLRRQARRVLATQFLKETDFGERLFPSEKKLMRIVVCPSFPFENRVNFSEPLMRNWLRENQPGGSEWLPFAQGVRLETDWTGWYSQNQLKGRAPIELRHFRNGAASICATDLAEGDMTLSGLRFLRRLNIFLEQVRRFYDQTGMTGEVLIEVAFLNINSVEFEPGISGFRWSGHKLQWTSDTLTFQVTTSGVNLLTNDGRWAVEREIMDRLVQCFGLWDIPAYFKQDGAPV